MVYEYALEPTLLTHQEVCHFIVNGVGVPKGRLVSEFPGHWLDLVHTAIAEAMPIGRARIIEAIARLRDRMFPRSHQWDDSQAWIDNAIEEHSSRPFRAILATTNPGRKRYILCDDDIDEINPLWSVDTTRTINRVSDEMAESVRLLLECGKEVIFADPHFGPENLRYRRPLEAFLEVLAHRNTDLPLRRVEYHTATNATGSFLEQAIREQICPRMPSSITLTIIRWYDHDDLHNRYVLTNRGGIMFHHGLDEGSSHDEISLMSKHSYKVRWRQFQKATSPFQFRDGFRVSQSGVSEIGPDDWG